MPFEIQVRYSTPLTPVQDADEVLREFLTLIGYLPEGPDPDETDRSVAYRLLRDCFLRRPERAWYPEELATVLKTTKPTLYRHVNRLKALDLLEEISETSEDGRGRKGYRIRYGDLSRAWDFVEAHAQNALKRYRETVDHLQVLLARERTPRAADPAAPAARSGR
jgi:predicted ArsR family transcriptional regulator